MFTAWSSTSSFHDGGRYHIETSLLICGANQWTGFYMITASVMKGLKAINSRPIIEIIKVFYHLKGIIFFLLNPYPILTLDKSPYQ